MDWRPGVEGRSTWTVVPGGTAEDDSAQEEHNGDHHSRKYHLWGGRDVPEERASSDQ